MTLEYDSCRLYYGHLASSISEIFGLRGGHKLQPLVELRTGPNASSITAHAGDHFAELVISNNGDLMLNETNIIDERHTATKLRADGILHVSSRPFNPQCGLTGPIKFETVSDPEAVITRIQDIVCGVSNLLDCRPAP